MTKHIVIKILIVAVVLIVAAMFMLNKKANITTQTSSEPIFTSQEECEEVTTMECSFSSCDYIPEGKTFEEVCGGVGKQWLPILDEN